ncbi:DNA-directed RNA polymerases I and III subunit RPAC2 [Carica papaya]|uniref:DNA-directed RNA polymerases I and III subunit RPAC2 n=1 Tax=Carica papaya TaxID=3649 RepID=UPI000B8D1397|nr:DNA-directed RNA polymerases I and III subunit RPAC2 [Carica papaya]
MEHGSSREGHATFSLTGEDHTLANALRFALNQDARVEFCGYSIPHPSDARVNIRVQTSGEPAREVLKGSCVYLKQTCEHVRGTFEKAIVEFRTSKPVEGMKIDSDSD